MSNELIIYNPQQAIEQAASFKAIITRMRESVLVSGVDYGVVPGTTKPTLLKPGAERLCAAFGLAPRFDVISSHEDWEKGFFNYRYCCVLTHIETGRVMGSGIGSCNSKESKYRWRTATVVCPDCGGRILKSKYPDRVTGEIGVYCKDCKANFTSDDPRITSQPKGRVENDDIFSQVNTLDKMAQKRALIAAVLITTNASEFFTQDMEDLASSGHTDVIEGDYTHEAPPVADRPAQPKQNAASAISRPFSPNQLPKVMAKKIESYGDWDGSVLGGRLYDEFRDTFDGWLTQLPESPQFTEISAFLKHALGISDLAANMSTHMGKALEDWHNKDADMAAKEFSLWLADHRKAHGDPTTSDPLGLS